jgi:exonuclease III
MISPGLKESVAAAGVFRRKKFSDHAPLTIDYEI